jgi:glycosyltransferase involved in cell wall biosynthesis
LPRVSFILPVRNAAQTLPRALDSLFAQTFADFEILAFDDGSDDDSPAVLERAAAADSRLRFVASEHVGLVEALRRLVEASDAPLLARMDADDISPPERLAHQIGLLDERPELALASCLIRCFPEESLAGGMRRYEEWLNSLVEPHEIARDIFVESPLCHPSVVMRRAAYERAGGYLDDALPEDYHLWLRFQRCELPMAKVPRVLFLWRDRPDRVTRTDPRCAPQRLAELKLEFLLSGPLAGRDRIAIWGAGPTGRRWARSLVERGIEIAFHVDVHPRKIHRRTASGAPIVAPKELERELPCGFMLVAVGAPGARSRIRRFLAGVGLCDPVDFVCVA